MSEPTTATSSAGDAPTREEENPEPLSFTLQVISTGPNSNPLSFPHLPATTTIKELKAKIRDALPTNPVDEHQRLIYRGRLLARETDTMLDIFGQETLASPEPQNIHLVLRPSVSDTLPIPPSVTVPMAEPPIRNNNLPPNFPPRPQSTPLVNPVQGFHQLPGFQHIHQHQVLPPNDINSQALRLQQMQRETQRLYQDIGMLEQRVRALVPPNMLNGQHPLAGQMGVPGMFQVPQRQAPIPPFPPGFPQFQTFVQQQQRERAAQGLHGAQDLPGNVPPSVSAPGSGRASPSLNRPDHTTTYTREGIGPNGQRWHVTVNETTTTLPQDNHHHHHHPHAHAHAHAQAHNAAAGLFQMGPFANMQMNPQVNAQANPVVAEIQAILRNADRLNAQNNMQRTASNSQHPQTAQRSSTLGAQQAGATEIAATSSMSNIAPPTSLPVSASTQVPPSVAHPQNPNEATAYILSSPSGPQALLLSNSGSFWTPRQSLRRQPPTTTNTAGHDGAAIVLPEFRNRQAHRAARRAQQNQQENAPEPINAAHANPGAGVIAAQVAPMIWRMVQLAGFVWFFTSGNTSWTRFFVISGLALLLFIANTGLFNGVAEQVWGPIRRHLDALIPLAGPDAALVPAVNAAVVDLPNRPAGENEQPNLNPGLRQRRRAPEPDPAEAAARILAQHRQNQGWLFTQARRAEHALLLFLASFIPGVGERHIAAREAAANAAEAERRRQIEAADVADATTNNPATVTEETTENGGNGETDGDEGRNHEETLPAERLLEA